MTKDYSKIEIDKKAIEASLKDGMSFRTYTYNGKPLRYDDHMVDSLIYMMDSQRMFYPELRWNRDVAPISETRSLWNKVKRYFTNLWLAIKGYDFED